MTAGTPVAVVIPAYRSGRTIAGCLEALRRQTLTGFETVVVDSSPDGEVERIVRAGFPEVRLDRSAERLLPHAARNRGAQISDSELVVFTDPDVYADPGWLTALVASHRATGSITVGALACHGRRWLDVGIHLCKFSTWLPAGAPRPVDMGPTANLLCPRGVFLELGGFPGQSMLGDTIFSWRALDRGRTLWFEPRAVVAHHHTQSVREFVTERYGRGAEFGRVRAAWRRHGRLANLAYLAASVVPLRLARVLALTAGRCARARRLGDLGATLPLVALGHLAWLAGESRAYAALLAGRAAAPRG